MIMIKWHSMAKFEVNNLLGGNSITLKYDAGET